MGNSLIAAQKPRPAAMYGITAGGLWVPLLVGSDGTLGVIGYAEGATVVSPSGGIPTLIADDTPSAVTGVTDGDAVAQRGTTQGEAYAVARLQDAAHADLVFVKSSMVVGQNALSTSAEVVIAADSSRMFAEITNDDAAIKCYVGLDNTVLSSTGHVLKPGASMSFEGYIGAIWMIAASGTPTVTFVYW